MVGLLELISSAYFIRRPEGCIDRRAIQAQASCESGRQGGVAMPRGSMPEGQPRDRGARASRRCDGGKQTSMLKPGQPLPPRDDRWPVGLDRWRNRRERRAAVRRRRRHGQQPKHFRRLHSVPRRVDVVARVEHIARDQQLALFRAFRRALLPADPSLRYRDIAPGGGAAAPRQDPVRHGNPQPSAPPGAPDPHPLAAHAAGRTRSAPGTVQPPCLAERSVFQRIGRFKCEAVHRQVAPRPVVS